MFSISRVVSDFSGLYQPIFTIIFLRSLMTLCCAMLIIQMEIVKYKFTYKMDIDTSLYIFAYHSPSQTTEIIQWSY